MVCGRGGGGWVGCFPCACVRKISHGGWEGGGGGAARDLKPQRLLWAWKVCENRDQPTGVRA